MEISCVCKEPVANELAQMGYFGILLVDRAYDSIWKMVKYVKPMMDR